MVWDLGRFSNIIQCDSVQLCAAHACKERRLELLVVVTVTSKAELRLQNDVGGTVHRQDRPALVRVQCHTSAALPRAVGVGAALQGGADPSGGDKQVAVCHVTLQVPLMTLYSC